MSAFAEIFLALGRAGVSDDLILRVVKELAEIEAKRIEPESGADVWVYVMAVDGPDEDLVKVGISKQPEWRKLELQKQRGLPLSIIHTVGPFLRPFALEVERRAHKRLSFLRERGEWFNGGATLAAGVIQVCAQEALQ